jgi:hypothetical protein
MPSVDITAFSGIKTVSVIAYIVHFFKALSDDSEKFLDVFFFK